MPSVSGNYGDSSFSIEFPPGWNGTLVSSTAGGKGYPMVSPAAQPRGVVSISVITVNRLEVKNLITSGVGGIIPPEPEGNGSKGKGGKETESQCQRTLAELIPVNGINVFHTVFECPSKEDEKKYGEVSDSYIFFTLTKSIAVVYSATSKDVYDRYLPDFMGSLNTVKVDEPVNIRSALEIVLGITKFYDKSVGIPVVTASAARSSNNNDNYNSGSSSKKVDMVIGASSNNVNVAFDEPGKRFVIRVNELAEQGGRLLVPVDKTLRGPYQVRVDGVPVPDPLVIEDNSTKEKLVLVEYGEGARQIVITGTQVVPEFPTSVAGIAFAAAVVFSSILIYFGNSRGRRILENVPRMFEE
ncbi:MAG TPA: hypothetical protein VHA09_02035 [Nitrososphaera sp.]|nr:hypothetical protein [Nitrososphaera sp.]